MTDTKIDLSALSGDRQAPLAGQLIAGIIILIAICQQHSNTKNYGYTIAMSCVAMVAALVGLVLVSKPATHNKQLFTLPVLGDITMGKLLGLFNFVWWAVGVGIVTFQAPFTGTGNGYFAAWAGFFASVMGIGYSSTEITSKVTSATREVGYLACAIVTLFALFDHTNDASGQVIFGLIWSLLTIILLVVFLALEGSGNASVAKVKFPLFALFAIGWVIAASMMTFDNPFAATGNGYFGSWGACVFSVIVTLDAHKQAPAPEVTVQKDTP